MKLNGVDVFVGFWVGVVAFMKDSRYSDNGINQKDLNSPPVCTSCQYLKELWHEIIS